jgi:hypothetical protein
MIPHVVFYFLGVACSPQGLPQLFLTLNRWQFALLPPQHRWALFVCGCVHLSLCHFDTSRYHQNLFICKATTTKQATRKKREKKENRDD